MATWKQNSEQHPTICTDPPLKEQDPFLPIYIIHLSTDLISTICKMLSQKPSDTYVNTASDGFQR